MVETVETITGWCESRNTWQARSACVAMLTWADKPPLYDGFRARLLRTAARNIQNQERFVQLGTGV